jgi:hypothetical protein
LAEDLVGDAAVSAFSRAVLRVVSQPVTGQRRLVFALPEAGT